MKTQKAILSFCLSLLLLPLWGDNNPKQLSGAYTSICPDCASYYQEVIAEGAYDDLVNLKAKLIPIIKVAESLKDDQILAFLYPKLRYVYTRKGSISEAIKVSLSFLELPDEFITKEQKIKEWGRLSEFYSQIGIQDEAYEYHLKAIEGLKKNTDADLNFRILFQSGTVFYFQKKYEKSIDFYAQALKLAESTPSLDKYINSSVLALTSVAIKNKDYPLAKKYCEQQLTKRVSPFIEAHAYQYLGDIFKFQEKIDSARIYYQKSLSIFEKISSSLKETELLLALANLALKQNNYQEAKQLFEVVLTNKSLQKKEHKAKTYSGLSRSYKELGDFKRAFQYQKAFSDLQPTLFSDSTSLKLDKLKAEFLLEKQAADLIQKQKALEQLEWQNIAFATGVGSLFMILLIVMWVMKVQRKAHRLTLKQKQQIEAQNTQLVDYNERLERFNSVVSHDLKQPLRTTLSMLGLFKRRYFDGLAEDAKDYLQLSDQALKQMYKLVEGLLSLTQLKKASEKDMVWINSLSLFIAAKTQLQTLIEEKNVEIKIHPSLEEWPIIRAHEGPMIQLWQNLLSNAIKFTPENRIPKIEVSVREKKHHYVFKLKDNGIGIDEEFQTKIFEMFKRLNARGAYEGNGIGLATCKQVVDLHDGNIWVKKNRKKSQKSGKDQVGSTFYFAIPKNKKSIPFREQLLLRAV